MAQNIRKHVLPPYGTLNRKSHLLLPGLLRMRTIFFIDSEQYYAYCTWYGRGTNLASVQFLLPISWCLTSVRAICVCVSSFRAIFWTISIYIRNNPSTFFQNTYTIFVRNFLFIFLVLFVKLFGNNLFRINRGTTVPCTVQL